MVFICPTMGLRFSWYLNLQVKDCLKQNEELRGILEKLRTEQAKGFVDLHNAGVNQTDSPAYASEIISLKVGFSLNATCTESPMTILSISNCWIQVYHFSTSPYCTWCLCTWKILSNNFLLGLPSLYRVKLQKNRAERKRYLQMYCSSRRNYSKPLKHIIVLHACETLFPHWSYNIILYFKSISDIHCLKTKLQVSTGAAEYRKQFDQDEARWPYDRAVKLNLVLYKQFCNKISFWCSTFIYIHLQSIKELSVKQR